MKEKTSAVFKTVFPPPQSLQIQDGLFAVGNLAFPPGLIQKYHHLINHFQVKTTPGQLKVVLKEKPDLGKEEYIIEAGKKGVTLTFGSDRGLFYGLSTLLQVISAGSGMKTIPAFRIRDFPQFPFRGFMLDVSRGAVPRMPVLKDLIVRLALLKITHLSLYIEDVLLSETFPGHNLKRSVLTPAEIGELVGFAKEFRLEIFPSFQTLCHLKNLLSHPAFRRHGLPFNPDCLNVADQEAVDFILNYTAEIADLFDSRWVNIGMDECEKGPAPADYLSHFLKIHQFYRKRGKRVMVWGDMLFKYRQLLSRIPKDVTVLNWDYNLEDEGGFRKKTEVFKASGLKQVLCPGTWSWAKFIPASARAGRNVDAAWRAAVKEKLEGVMLTSWGDDGNEYLLPGIYLTVFKAGNLFWSGKESHPEAFGLWSTGRKDLEPFKIFTFLSQIDRPLPFHHRYYLFEDPIFPAFSSQTNAEALISQYRKAALYLRKKNSAKNRLNDFFYFVQALLELIAAKVEFSSLLPDRLISNQTGPINETCQNLLKQIEELKMLYQNLWNRTYKIEGLFPNLMKFTQLQERLKYLNRLTNSPHLRLELIDKIERYAIPPCFQTVEFQRVFDQ